MVLALASAMNEAVVSAMLHVKNSSMLQVQASSMARVTAFANNLSPASYTAWANTFAMSLSPLIAIE